MVRKNSFPPVVAPDTRVLVLGSLPGERSLAVQRYYAHPQNRFWHLIGKVIGVGATTGGCGQFSAFNVTATNPANLAYKLKWANGSSGSNPYIAFKVNGSRVEIDLHANHSIAGSTPVVGAGFQKVLRILRPVHCVGSNDEPDLLASRARRSRPKR